MGDGDASAVGGMGAEENGALAFDARVAVVGAADDALAAGSPPCNEVRAPPELLMVTFGDEPLLTVDVDSVAPDGVVELDEEASNDEEEPDGDVVDEESDTEESDDDADELESDDDELVSSARAMPGVVATAAPTPIVTASAPTRPMYLAYPMVITSAP